MSDWPSIGNSHALAVSGCSSTSDLTSQALVHARLTSISRRIGVIARRHGVRIPNLPVLALDRQFASAVVAQDVACAIDRGSVSVSDDTCPIGAHSDDFPTAIFPLLNDSPVCSHSWSPS